MAENGDYHVFEAGDVVLQSGVLFRSVRLVYKTYGTLNARKDNVIVYPTSFSAQHYDTEWLVQRGGALDPDRYFIIIPNLFGNGLSSSPSNSGETLGGAPFPTISYHDAVAVQRRLLVEQFGISKIALVYGWSMGGMQAYHWAACHADMVERAAIVCGSAKCSPYNHVFLEGVKAALTADPAFRDGRFVAKPTAGLRAMGRVYAGWAMSHAFYVWREAGFHSLEDYLARAWDGLFARRDANDLLTQIGIWQRGDISQCPEFGGDIDRALAAITARILLVPGQMDRYFDMHDNEVELGRLVNARSAELHPIPSIHGHRAGNPVNNPVDGAFIHAEISALLQSRTRPSSHEAIAIMDTTASSGVKHRDKPLSPAMLRELSARSDLQGIVRIVSHYSAIAIVGTLIWVVSSTSGILWAVPLLPLQGYFVAFLFMPLHETAHKTAFQNRTLNIVVGHLSAILIAQPYEYYCLFHWEHHRHTQDPDRDPELIVGPKPASDTQLAIAYSGLQHLAYRVRLMLRHAFTGKVTMPWIPAGRRDLIVREACLHVAVYAVLLLASLTLHTAILLWVWIVPLLVGQMILRPYLYAEHTGCERTRSAFENTRTTATGMVMKWFAWNMPYHVEHHAYPSVPFHALPKLNQIVADQIVYRGWSYRAVTRETWAWFRRARHSGL